MNERIEELRFQAWDYVASCDDQYSKSATDLFEEKFAELIVKECAGLFEIEWGEEKLTGNDVGYVVKKHFGVEE